MPGTKLDPIDRRILAELQADGRMTNVELARRVGISAPPCLRRVRTLEEAGYEARARAWPLVRECHMLNGEIDFILKCVSPDLSTFQSFLTEELLKADNVASVKTSLVIRGAKAEPGVPFEVLEDRLARRA
jgi:DNA-binding Lrp family transcriptional regulator